MECVHGCWKLPVMSYSVLLPLSEVARHIKKGALTAQAARAGKSMSELCANPKTSLTRQRCNLRKTFAKFRPKGRRSKR